MNIQLNELADYLAKSVSKDAPHYRQEYDKLIAERDTSDVWRQFAIWLLVDPDDGVIRFTKPDSKEHAAINHVAHLYAQNCEDETIWHKAARSARSAACSAFDAVCSAFDDAYRAAARAAEAAVEAAYHAGAAAVKAAAEDAAEDAAAEAARAANAAAWATARAAAWATAGAAAFAEAHRRMADKLLELLQLAPPKEIP